MQLSVVYACVRIIAETVGSLPLNIYERTEDGNSKVARGHPLYRILHDAPNTEMTSMIWRETSVAHDLLWGNSYTQIIRNGRGEIIALYPLLPEKMKVDRDENGQLYYDYQLDNGTVKRLLKRDLLHVPALGFDGVMGYSPIAMQKNTIGLTIAAEDFGSRFFKNDARPSGVLEMPGKLKEGDPQKLRAAWNSAYGGGNRNRVAVLEEGMKFSPMSMPNDDAQFLETRQFQLDEICRIYRVPPHMVANLAKATFSNIEHQSIDFAMHTIRPWIVRYEQSMNIALLNEFDYSKYYISFNMDGLLRGDYKSRMEGYAVGRQNGWMSANDIRRLENMNLIPAEEGGDLYLVNGNMMPLNNAGAAYGQNNADNGGE